MIDSIINTLKNEVAGDILKETDVKESQMDDIMDVIKKVAGEQVMKQMAGGGLNNVMNLFSKNENSKDADSLQSDISSGIAGGLMKKLGITPAQASKIASIALPALMNMITSKNQETPDDDASPLKDIFGGSKGLGDLAGKSLGGLFK